MDDRLVPGPKNLITDVSGLKVGNAKNARLKSGATVLTAEKAFVASVHVMGGAPGTRETDLLGPDKTVSEVDALVLSGGSGFGLDAGSGVADALRKGGKGFQVGNVNVPIVPGAILFDLINGGAKDWDANPYRALGEEAYENASSDFDLGSEGAGTGALTAAWKGGLGSASLTLPDGTIVGALVAANPLGSPTTPGSRHFWAAPFEIDKEFGGLGPDPKSNLSHLPETKRSVAMKLSAQDGANTTIGIVATSASLTKAQCHRLAVNAHDGIARAIVPAHSPFDGDLLFALSTCEGPPADEAALALIGHAAALCVSRSIARAVFEATPEPGDLLQSWRQVGS